MRSIHYMLKKLNYRAQWQFFILLHWIALQCVHWLGQAEAWWKFIRAKRNGIFFWTL